MNEREVIRRINAILALPASERPISIDRLESVAGISSSQLYQIAKQGTMLERTRKRLAIALRWVENNQLVITKRPNRPTVVTIREPKPPQSLESFVSIDPTTGPTIQKRAFNPRTFPKFRG